MVVLSKKIYFVIIIESLLVFLFWLSKSFINEGRFIYWIFPVFIGASLACNVFLSRGKREMLSSFALLQSFFVSIIFFQTLVSEYLAKGVAIGSALIFLVVVFGFLSVMRNEMGISFHATKPSMIHVLSLLTLFFIVYDIYALRVIFPLPTILIFLIFLLSVTLTHYATTNLLLGSLRNFYSTFILGVLMIAEFFTVAYFAPIPVYAKGVMVATAYYTFLGIVEVQNLPVIDRKTLKTYIGIGLASFALILLTARWR